ncbi:MAG: FAD-binding oxidoreductase [Litorilinea sp.]
MQNVIPRMATLDNPAVQALEADFKGVLVHPTDPNYDEVRAVYNAMIDRYPALIARCADTVDVARAVNFARDHQIKFAVRGGGHSGGGLGTLDDGLVIDLSLMNKVQVDPETRTAWVEGGATLADMDNATHAFGLAMPSGINSTTGIGGLTLGGGLGHLTRHLGLTIDNLIAAQLVLADGSIVQTSADEHPDLFWAIRGGGGNFGVVTAFQFQLHPISTVTLGLTFWALEDAKRVMQWYRDFLPAQPDEVNGFFSFFVVPPNDPFPEELHHRNVCGVFWCYSGPQEQAEALFAQVRHVAPLIFEFIAPLPYPTLQSMFDAGYPAGDQWYWKADFIKEIPDAAIEQHIKFGSHLPTPQSTMHLYPIDGAAGRVGASDTAWAYRDARWGMVIVGVDPDPGKKEQLTEWARAYWEAIHPYSAGGAYVNMMMENEGQARVQAAYRHNYVRLAQIKSKYDPANLFRRNQNIEPAASASATGRRRDF